MALLQLDKPLVFFDLETTGITVGHDRIVEVSLVRLQPDHSRKILTRRVNPGIPIPPAASAVHGIYDADVANEPLFEAVAAEIAVFIGNSDLAGYNSNRFDVPMLVDEFLRVGYDFTMKGRRLVDVQNIFHKMEQRTLVAAYRFYCGKELEGAHGAEADTLATLEVLLAQLEKYPELRPDVSFLRDFSSMNRNVDLAGRLVLNENSEAVFNFGKHKGKTVHQVFSQEPSYYEWMMQGDFSLETKRKITELRLAMKK